ncbi:MAG: hydroxymethylbilane synthase [Ignavibacteriaceae bacterium]|jgi:hydroxymethylbilane synthase|nr:hydroxymethylbilane synthase [Ignavibacteriaceae bacterium]
MRKRKLIIGTRGSALALWQAKHIKTELLKRNENLKVEIKIIKTTGDKILDVALSKIGDKGLFTKELENELLTGSIDLAVHSLKDLQTIIPKGLKLAAVTKRHAVNDVLIAREKGIGLQELKENAIIATGSLRRKSQILHIRPDFRVVELRGNVPTRIEKFLESGWDAIILAQAGVERLGLKKYISSYIPLEQILPAVGQGALGIEISENNDLALDAVLTLNDDKTLKEVSAERSLMRKLEGGCQVPIGAFGELKGNGLYLSAFVGSVDGSLGFKAKARGEQKNPEGLGTLMAKALVKAGAKEILDELRK